tara:strand:+ start:5200 stop:6402 length:1203 start_codon:yes stop_codon:yes gene_type:complete
MGEISGVPTADINNVDGFFTSQTGGGGSGVQVNSIAAGAQLFGSTSLWMRSDVPQTFSRSEAFTTVTFSKIECNRGYTQVMALTSSGQLWYNCDSSTYLGSGFTADKTWRRYGTDTDWTDLAGGNQVWGAIKGGDYYFMGTGSYRQRGDGSTSGVTGWSNLNSSQTWSKVFFGFRHTWLISASGEAYSTGYSYDYMTGQGTTGTVSTFAREKNSLTNIVEASGGYRCAWLRDSSGNTYFSGNNANRHAGPLITSGSDQNGPVAASTAAAHYNCAKLGTFSYHGGCHIDSDGYLRFSGEATGYMRPDNSTTDKKNSDGGYQLTSMGSGWTDYRGQDKNGSANEHNAVALKSGAMWNGGEDSAEFKGNVDPDGNASDTRHWVEVVSSGVNCVAQRAAVLAKG